MIINDFKNRDDTKYCNHKLKPTEIIMPEENK